MTAFIPPTHIHLYMPIMFKLWEAFNSSIIDDRIIELCGELSEEHVAGKYGDAGEEGGAEWKDVGIWSDTEWTVLVGKALGAMSTSVQIPQANPPDDLFDPLDVPVGSIRVSCAYTMVLSVC